MAHLYTGAALPLPYVRSARLGGGDIRMSRRLSSLRFVKGLRPLRGCRRYPYFKSTIYFYANMDYYISER